jgi:hypothetical protein
MAAKKKSMPPWMAKGAKAGKMKGKPKPPMMGEDADTMKGKPKHGPKMPKPGGKKGSSRRKRNIGRS